MKGKKERIILLCIKTIRKFFFTFCILLIPSSISGMEMMLNFK